MNVAEVILKKVVVVFFMMLIFFQNNKKKMMVIVLMRSRLHGGSLLIAFVFQNINSLLLLITITLVLSFTIYVHQVCHSSLFFFFFLIKKALHRTGLNFHVFSENVFRIFFFRSFFTFYFLIGETSKTKEINPVLINLTNFPFAACGILWSVLSPFFKSWVHCWLCDMDKIKFSVVMFLNQWWMIKVLS